MMNTYRLSCCCGIDVHKETLVACVLKEGSAKQLRTFETYGGDLLQLCDWLQSLGCTHVVMESTGAYWRPVFAALEASGTFDVTVANAQHVKNVPGRKSDASDAEWLARLLRDGLLRKSFVPELEFRQARELVRFRRTLVESRSDVRNRVERLLQSCTIKLSTVASDIFGVSGRAILRALAQGRTDAAALAELARGLLRKKLPQLVRALDGRMDETNRFILDQLLGQHDELESRVAEVEARIDAILRQHTAKLEALQQIPGISETIAEGVVAEVGVTLATFETPAALASWAGICPGNNESAGKNLGGHTRKGNQYLKTLLVEAAQAATRKKGSYFRDKFHRLKARRGYKRALIAIAHKILIAIFHVLKGEAFKDLGEAYLERRRGHAAVRHHIERLAALGYQVTPPPMQAQAPA